MNEPNQRVVRPEAKGTTIPQRLKSSGLILTADHWQLPPHQCGPVVCAATSSGKEYLVKHLLAALAGQIPHGLRSWQGSPQLARDSLGQPILLLDGVPFLAVSFSLGGGKIWGALAGAGRVGVDVAFAPEFPADYPLPAGVFAGGIWLDVRSVRGRRFPCRGPALVPQGGSRQSPGSGLQLSGTPGYCHRSWKTVAGRIPFRS